MFRRGFLQRNNKNNNKNVTIDVVLLQQDEQEQHQHQHQHQHEYPNANYCNSNKNHDSSATRSSNNSNSSIVYDAGTSINGIVIIELKKPMKVSSNKDDDHHQHPSRSSSQQQQLTSSTTSPYLMNFVSFEFHGTENVRMRRKQHYIKRWCQQQSIHYSNQTKLTSSSSSTSYTKPVSRELYSLNGILDAFPLSSYDEQTKTIRPGTYTFPFTIPLPDTVPSSIYYNSKRNCIVSSTTNTNTPNKKLTKMPPGFCIEYVLSIQLQNEFRTSSLTSSYRQQTLNKFTKIYSSYSTNIMVRSKSPPHVQADCIHHHHRRHRTTSIPSSTIKTITTMDLRNPQNGKMFIASAKLDCTQINISSDNTNNNNTNSCCSIPLRISCRNVSYKRIRRVEVNVIETFRWGRTRFRTDITTSNSNTTTTTSGRHSTNSTSSSSFYLQHEGIKRTLYTVPNIQAKTIQTQRLGLFSSTKRSLLRRVSSRSMNTYNKNNQCCHRDRVSKALCDDILYDLQNNHATTSSTNESSSSSLVSIHLPDDIIVQDEYTNGRLVQIDHEIEIVFKSSKQKKNNNNNNNNSHDLTIVIPINLYKCYNKANGGSNTTTTSSTSTSTATQQHSSNSTNSNLIVDSSSSFDTQDAIGGTASELQSFDTISSRGIHSSTTITSSVAATTAALGPLYAEYDVDSFDIDVSASSSSTMRRYEWISPDSDTNQQQIPIPLVPAIAINDYTVHNSLLHNDNQHVECYDYDDAAADDYYYQLQYQHPYYEQNNGTTTATAITSDENNNNIVCPATATIDEEDNVIPLSSLHPLQPPSI